LALTLRTLHTLCQIKKVIILLREPLIEAAFARFDLLIAPPRLTFLLMVVSGWVHRRQFIVIEFL